MSAAYEHLWRSGRLVASAEATVHVRSAGHASVSAVFEGINAYWSAQRGELHVFRLGDHLRRLLESVRLAQLACEFEVADLEAAVIALLQRNDVRRDVHIRPWCFAAGDPTEQMVPTGAPCETAIDSWPFASGLAEHRVRTAAVSSWRRIGADAMPPRVKAFANYHNGRLGNADAERRGADWPIFLNDRGAVTESSGANVALFKDGAFHTPSLDCGILRGVTRDTVMELLRANLDIPVSERHIDRVDLYTADELVFLGTSAEVLPIVRVDGHRIGDGDVGPITARLRSLYDAVVHAEVPQYGGWLTPVWR
jgi:branched-chain amino acid aminotransferase